MSLFGKIVKTSVNLVLVPAALVVDVVAAPVTAARWADGEEPLTQKAIETLKREADED